MSVDKPINSAGLEFQMMTPMDATNLRDQFAMFALSGILASPHRDREVGPNPAIARLAYHYADAMLKAREEKHE